MLLVVAGLLAIAAAVLGTSSLSAHQTGTPFLALGGTAVAAGAVIVAGIAGALEARRANTGVEAARERLRSAEARLAGDLAGTASVINIYGDVHELRDAPGQSGAQDQQVAQDLKGQESQAGEAPQSSSEYGREDRLALAALWEVTHSQLDLYHQIATDQARRSFFTAQVATGIGFILLVVFAVLATRTHTTAGAITTGTLGAVSAALAGYIGRTFVRSQESAADHLRAYFDQPLEFSKYLAAERLLAGGPDLDGDQRTTIITAVIQAMLIPGSYPKGAKNGRAAT